MTNVRAFVVCLFGLSAMATEMSASDSAKQLSAGNAKFTSAFFDQIRHKEGNLFFSPVSIEAVLALAHAGAGGKTATQIQQAVHLPENKETTAKLYAQLIQSLVSDQNVVLNFANGMYADKTFAIKEQYNEIVKNGFQAQIGQVEFAKAQEAADTINGFVAKNTNNMIPTLFEPSAFNENTKMVLLNAIYFKGDWANKFAEKATQKGTFHLNENEQKEVDFMHITKKFNVQKNEELDAQIIELPYKGDTMSMIIIVPNTINGLKQIETKLATTDLTQIFETRRKREVNLTMPKFKLEETIDLNDLLIKLGMEDMFSETKADFSGISDSTKLFVSKALQKARIEVNEAGSEAAAATGLAMMVMSMPPPPIDVKLDKPFLFQLIHNPTGLRLFMGRVAVP